MTLRRPGPFATTSPNGAAAAAVPAQPGRAVREALRARSATAPQLLRSATPVRDLRGRGADSPRQLTFAGGDVVVVSGLPGSGKSTLISRAVAGHAVDSQETRERWETRMPGLLPYAVYRPLVRLAHYAGLWHVLRSGKSVVVHDCGTQTWVRRLLAREARRRGRSLHLLLLDVTPDEALSGQAARGRGVSRYAFARHRHTVTRLLGDAEAGRVPRGCSSTVLLDRASATQLTGIGFGP
ncbi:AAA family ATPase [Streptomyces sp. NPDC006879]|uniref:AAA family ATPase n=1 Tax=Streptomyces sp. NPDC006879 TaxID=3364767 RepID=UPI0036C68872